MEEIGLHYGYEISSTSIWYGMFTWETEYYFAWWMRAFLLWYVLPLDLLDGGLISFTGLAWLCLVGREYGGVFGSVLAVETVDRVVDKMGMDGTGYYHQMKEKRR